MPPSIIPQKTIKLTAATATTGTTNRTSVEPSSDFSLANANNVIRRRSDINNEFNNNKHLSVWNTSNRESENNTNTPLMDGVPKQRLNPLQVLQGHKRLQQHNYDGNDDGEYEYSPFSAAALSSSAIHLPNHSSQDNINDICDVSRTQRGIPSEAALRMSSSLSSSKVLNNKNKYSNSSNNSNKNNLSNSDYKDNKDNTDKNNNHASPNHSIVTTNNIDPTIPSPVHGLSEDNSTIKPYIKDLVDGNLAQESSAARGLESGATVGHTGMGGGLMIPNNHNPHSLGLYGGGYGGTYGGAYGSGYGYSGGGMGYNFDGLGMGGPGMGGFGGLGGMGTLGAIGMGGGGLLGMLQNVNQFLFGIQAVVFSLGQAVHVISANADAVQRLFEAMKLMFERALTTLHELRIMEKEELQGTNEEEYNDDYKAEYDEYSEDDKDHREHKEHNYMEEVIQRNNNRRKRLRNIRCTVVALVTFTISSIVRRWIRRHYQHKHRLQLHSSLSNSRPRQQPASHLQQPQ